MSVSQKESVRCDQCGCVLEAEPTTKGCLNCLLAGGLDSSTSATNRFQHYEVCVLDDHVSLHELGRGAMGITYQAVDRNLGSAVALKVINARHSENPQVRARFLREARAAAQLRHPNIASVFHFGETEEGQCFYAMELVDGETIEARVRREGPIGWSLALDIVAQAARALVAAEAEGLIHRDLKPSNIMIVNEEANDTSAVLVKVIDFGLAKAGAIGGDESDLGTSSFSGTPDFASPEQLHGTGSGLDVRSDIYSLGVTLWYLLHGKTPFESGFRAELCSQPPGKPLPEEGCNAAKVPAPLIRLLRSILATNPADRPQSARELLIALRRCRDTLEAPNPRRRFLQLAGIGLLILLCAVGLAINLLRWRSPGLSVLTNSEKSIAVLPFENLSDDKQNAYFAAGVQDEILTDLAKIADLKVIGRESVMHYSSGSPRNLSKIGEELGATHLLKGSVQRVASRVRVNAQLIDARTEARLWAETYDRDLADVFSIQSEIAQTIADRLRSKLSPAEVAAIAEHPTSDLRAYELYAEAKAIGDWNSDVKETAIRQIELLEEATRRDPQFALAYCLLADAHFDLYWVGDHSQLQLMKAAAEAAARLRPDLPEMHLLRARTCFLTHDFNHARSELTIARRGLPNSPEAFLIVAKIDRRENRWEKALAGAREACDLDPRNGEILLWICETLDQMRRYGESEQWLRQSLSRRPDMANVIQEHLAEVKLHDGDAVAARSILAKLPPTYHLDQDLWDARFTAELYLHDYDGASRAIAATPANWAEGVFVGLPPQSWADGQIARARGDQPRARTAFAAARERFDASWASEAKDYSYFAQVAALDAGLERKKQAIDEARRAVELMPIGKDAWIGPGLVRNLALVYAWTGERDLAIEQLESVAKIPFGPSFGDLRLNPCWDSLRGNPRFEKMLASLVPGSQVPN
jgi:serine/threonine protein kinase